MIISVRLTVCLSVRLSIHLSVCPSSQWKMLKTLDNIAVGATDITSNIKNGDYINTSLAAKGALAHRLQRRMVCKIQNGRQGAPKWLMGSGKMFTS